MNTNDTGDFQYWHAMVLPIVNTMRPRPTSPILLGAAEILLGVLEQHGFSRTSDPALAQAILLNTCAIRQKAEQKIFSRLGELKALKTTRSSEKRYGARAQALSQFKVLSANQFHVILEFSVHHRSPVCVGVIGCMAERLKDQLFKSKAVDIVAGPDALRSLPALIDTFTQVVPQTFLPQHAVDGALPGVFS